MEIQTAFASDQPVLEQAFGLALDDLRSNIQPFQDGLLDRAEPCILAGQDYTTPWTRDTAINVWNGAGLFYPAASRSTLLAVLERDPAGRVRIGGQYWDAIIWTTGAWAYYLYTGDRDMLALAFEATQNSLARYETEEYDPQTGLFRGPACYGDGVAAYPDAYARTDGSSSILDWPRCNPDLAAPRGYGLPMQALSTNCLYYHAYALLDEMAGELGQPPDPRWRAQAGSLKAAIHRHFWDPQRQSFRYLVDPFGGSDHEEGLGSSFAVLLGVASADQARRVLAGQTITPHGIPCVWPSFARYQKQPGDYGRHSGTVWPPIQGFWAEACARLGQQNAFGFELFTLARLAARDGMFAEIYHPETGEPYGGLQEGAPGWRWESCRRQTWSATAFLRMVLIGLLGMRFAPEGVAFQPLLPEGVRYAALRGLPYHAQTLNVTVRGSGGRMHACRVDGQAAAGAFLPAAGQGERDIVIDLE